MKSFLEKTGGRFFLLFFVGFYLITALTIQFREVLAESESAVLGSGIALVFLALWTYLGSMIIPYAWLEKHENHTLLLSLTVMVMSLAALASQLIGQLTLLLPENVHSGIHLLSLALMTLPIGVWIGVGMAVLREGQSVMGKYLNLCGMMLGMLGGGVILALAVERVAWGNQWLLSIGLLIILWDVVGSYRLLYGKRSKQFVTLCALLAIGLNLLIFVASESFMKNELRNLLPGWRYQRSVELPIGRMSFWEKIKEQEFERSAYRIYLNRRLMWSLPEDSDLFTAGLLPVMLQNLQPNQRVLIVAPPFYQGAGLLASLPQVGRVDLVCPYRNLFDYSGEKNMLSGFIKTMYIPLDPVKYIRATPEEYDAIILLDPELLEPGRRDEFIDLARSKLLKDGIFVMPAFFARDPLKNHFKFTGRVPGCRELLMGSDTALSSDIKELGKRFEGFLSTTGMNAFFPLGTFEVLYSLRELRTAPTRDPQKKDLVLSVLPLSPQTISYWGIALLATAFGGYFWLRFLLTRQGNNALKMMALENGIYGAGFFFMVLLIYQWRGLLLHQQIGLLLGLAGAAVAGEIIPLRPLGRVIITVISCLLPLMFFYHGEYHVALLIAAVALANISLGQVNQELERRRTVLAPAELNKWYLGGMFYGFAGILIFLCIANLTICCIVLIMLRLFALGMMFGARK